MSIEVSFMTGRSSLACAFESSDTISYLGRYEASYELEHNQGDQGREIQPRAAHHRHGQDPAEQPDIRFADGREDRAQLPYHSVVARDPRHQHVDDYEARVELQEGAQQRADRCEGHAYEPNSFDRLTAASTAADMAERKPPASSCSTAAMVEPPGLATPSTSCSGCCPVFSRSSTVPLRVCTASACATSRVSPWRTPARASASMNIATYAGPPPEMAVAASWYRSSRTIASPIAANISRTASTCSAVVSLPPLTTAIPCRTSAGVLGITLTTAVPAGTSDSSRAHVIPAAIDTTRVPGVSASASERTTRSMTCGFTARSTMSAGSASRPSATTRTRCEA